MYLKVIGMTIIGRILTYPKTNHLVNISRSLGSNNYSAWHVYMKYQELSDKQWKTIVKYLPKYARTGRPRCDDRTTINGILFVAITGCRWEELPEKYGSKSTVHLRLQNWQQKGIWKKNLSKLIKSTHKQNKINLRYISIDSSSIPAKKREMWLDDGFKRITGTKIHVAVESNGLPISIVCSPANIHDSTKFIDVIENISDFADDESIKQIVSCFADKGYDSTLIRNYLRYNGINCCIPYKSNSKFIISKSIQNNYNKTRFVVEGFFT